jgi:hypothetical protein
MSNSKKRKNNSTKNIFEENKNVIPNGYDLTILFDYIKARADFEGAEFKLELNLFNSGYEKGCRTFFGVTINDLGFPLHDEQEPQFGFLNNFICWHFITFLNN